MAETWTGGNIKRLAHNLILSEPILHKIGITDAASMVRTVRAAGYAPERRAHITLEQTAENAYTRAESMLKKNGKYKLPFSLWKKWTEILIEELNKEQSAFTEKFPIIFQSDSISENGDTAKGRDTKSPRHLLTTQILNGVNHAEYPINFLDKIQLWSLDPITQVLGFLVHPEDTGLPVSSQRIGIKDVLERRIETEIAQTKVGPGSTRKFDDEAPSYGNFLYKRELWEAVPFPEEEYPDESEDQRRYRQALEVKLSQHVLAMRYGYIFDRLLDHAEQKMAEFTELSIPLYMKKTGPHAEIIKLIPKYSREAAEDPELLRFMRNDKGGVMKAIPESRPTEGVCHPSALRVLFGFMKQCFINAGYENQLNESRPKKQPHKPKIRLKHCRRLPFLLAENGTHLEHPNIEDFAHEILTQQEIELMRQFARRYGLAWAGNEARLVELMTRDQNVYVGIRNLNRENRRWQAELKEKKIILPGDFPDWLDNVPGIERTGDIRASELSLPTAPIINERWMQKWEEGIIDAGCTIEKLMGALECREIILRGLKTATADEKDTFFKFYDEQFNCIPAIRGTAIHRVTGDDMPGLVHHKTLELLGLEPRPRTHYCETPISDKWNVNGEEFTVTMHPDLYVFLQTPDNKYDVLIMDTKTNRVMQYIKHSYLQQTSLYGIMIRRLLERQHGVDVGNIYVVLNQNAFYTGFDGNSSGNVRMYRPQKFSPITLWTPQSDIHKIMPDLLSTIAAEKRMLRTDGDYFIEYKKTRAKCGSCKKCFLTHKWACDYAAGQIQDGREISDILESPLV